mmetsp:Transcript_9761/g.23180  ORF Transcript_9761/g.23180 Transcript_9761/m.23180 type:complete len:221 (+) Transcript_9761:330-992(+)
MTNHDHHNLILINAYNGRSARVPCEATLAPIHNTKFALQKAQLRCSAHQALDYSLAFEGNPRRSGSKSRGRHAHWTPKLLHAISWKVVPVPRRTIHRNHSRHLAGPRLRHLVDDARTATLCLWLLLAARLREFRGLRYSWFQDFRVPRLGCWSCLCQAPSFLSGRRQNYGPGVHIGRRGDNGSVCTLVLLLVFEKRRKQVREAAQGHEVPKEGNPRNCLQ